MFGTFARRSQKSEKKIAGLCLSFLLHILSAFFMSNFFARLSLIPFFKTECPALLCFILDLS